MSTMDRIIPSRNGYKLIKGIESDYKHVHHQYYFQNHKQQKHHQSNHSNRANGAIKTRLNHNVNRRKVIPSFYALLIIFVVTLLVILVNKIPTGPKLYPDSQYQIRLNANYYKPPVPDFYSFVLDTQLLIKPRLDRLSNFDNTHLVVIVSSSVDHFEQRQAIRDTWAKLIDFHQQKLFFIIGKPSVPSTIQFNSSYNSKSSSVSDSNIVAAIDGDNEDNVKQHSPINLPNQSLKMMDELSRRIVQEDKSFHDLIQYDFYDSYYNLTLKSLLILRFFNQEVLNLTKDPVSYQTHHRPSLPNSMSTSSPNTSQPNFNSPNRPYDRLKQPLFVANGMDSKIKKPLFLLKVDDDMFVQVNNLIKLIDRLMVAFKVRKIPWNHQQDGYKILLGGLIKKAQPIRDPKSKYFVPITVYPYNEYPNYLSGTGYLMSADVARSLFITSTFTKKCKYFFLEDLFVTGFCASKAVKMFDDYRYHENKLMDVQLMQNFGFCFREIGSAFDICSYLSPYIITIHGLSPSQIHYLWNKINSPAKTLAYCNKLKRQRKGKG